MEILHTTGIHKQVGEPKKVRKKVQPSGNRKDLKCVRRRRRRRRLWSMSIDSYVQYISCLFYTIVKFTQYITLLFTFFIIMCT